MGLLPDKNEAVMSDEILIIDSDRAHSQALAPFIGRRQFNLSITESMEAVVRRGLPPWIDVDKTAFSGTVKTFPVREDLTTPMQEQLIVELYSKSKIIR